MRTSAALLPKLNSAVAHLGFSKLLQHHDHSQTHLPAADDGRALGLGRRSSDTQYGLKARQLQENIHYATCIMYKLIGLYHHLIIMAQVDLTIVTFVISMK